MMIGLSLRHMNPRTSTASRDTPDAGRGGAALLHRLFWSKGSSGDSTVCADLHFATYLAASQAG